MGRKLSTLPERVQKRLQELEQALVASLGEDLVALVVHGSAARGGYRESTSDVDLVVVLEDDGRETLEAIGPALKLARMSARIEAILVRADELACAADVFPLLWDDVKQDGVCIYGKNPFAKLTIHDDHRRLRIEQELREARMRLRRLLVEADDDAHLAGALDRKVKQLASPLRALLALRGAPSADHAPLAVLKAAAKHYKVGIKAVRSLPERPREAYDQLAALMEAATGDCDGTPQGAS